MTTSANMGRSYAKGSLNTNGQLYGTSPYLGPPEGERLVAEAELEQFAPCPFVCCQCLVPDKARGRTYIRSYENRIETNWPVFPCCCCSKERCMADDTRVFFYDKPPNRAGMWSWCIPCICCGPPVLFNHIPRCCCGIIDCRPCCGETIRCAPCNLGNLRCCIFCGTPCYYYCSCPLFWPVKNGEVFLSKWRGALEAYGDSHNLRRIERARFKRVADRCCDCDAVETIQATAWPPPPQAQVMDDRVGGAAPSVAHVPFVPDSPTRSVRSHESSPKNQNPQDDEPPPMNPEYHVVQVHAIDPVLY
jgi:hypothetical protein